MTGTDSTELAGSPGEPLRPSAAFAISRAHLNDHKATVAAIIDAVPAWELVGGLLEINRLLGMERFGGSDQFDAELRDSLARLRADEDDDTDVY